MSSSRRDFLHKSAAAAAALSLGTLPAAVAAELPDDRGRVGGTAARADDSRVRAHPVPLQNVRLTGGPLQKAQQLDAAYLLSLDPDRMMAYYRVRAGLPQKAAPYAGWDGDGRNLTGHIAGHHLSAVSLMYLATGDDRFKQRADYLVRELKEVQDKNGDGYLSALANGREAFGALQKGEIRSAAFDLNGLWSPWYTLHKTFAGLRDAHRYTNNKTALDVEVKFAGWAEGILAPLSDEQLAHMLNTEHGGMNEVLADLYVDTGDKRWLDLSYKFEHHAFTDALKRGQDNLNGKHGNCQIPKMVGSAARYTYTGDAGDLMAASFFWDAVAAHHSYATGGHGLAEYFGPPDVLGARVDGRTCESCNVYNMLKLTRRMFSIRPDAYYSDFQERALFNHALSSMDLDDGRTSYMVPVGRGVQQEYQDMQQSFTCCVGTGMENHALHGDGIYYEFDDTLWVTIFAPSTAKLTRGALNGAQVAMDTSFPDGDSATLTFTLPMAREFTLMLRRPSWAGDGFSVSVNGTPIPQPSLASLRAGAAGGIDFGTDQRVLQPSSFVEIKRAWQSGDKVQVSLPKAVRLEATPDVASIAAIMWGPLVLAGNWGPRNERRGEGRQIPVPVLVSADKPLGEWVVPAGAPGDFTAKQVARVPSAPAAPADVALQPFYRTDGRVYSVYFDVVTPKEFVARAAAVVSEAARVKRMEAATTGYVRVGSADDEKQFNYQSDPANRQAQRGNGRSSRGGPGWFSYDLPVDGSAEMALVVTYFNDPGLRPASGDFDIQVDGANVAHFEPNPTASGFFDATYAVTPAVTQGKAKAAVRFQATAPNGRVAPVYGVRMVRASQL